MSGSEVAKLQGVVNQGIFDIQN